MMAGVRSSIYTTHYTSSTTTHPTRNTLHHLPSTLHPVNRTLYPTHCKEWTIYRHLAKFRGLMIRGKYPAIRRCDWVRNSEFLYVPSLNFQVAEYFFANHSAAFPPWLSNHGFSQMTVCMTVIGPY